MNLTSLSKTIAFALRHEPWKFELELDEQGWISVEQLLYALREEQRYAAATREDIETIVRTDEKGRYELSEGRIRALYGHSLPLRVEKTPDTPPDVLYHGTARRFLPSILAGGLTPQKRQYVHLSAETEMAHSVGARRDDSPAILRIDAARAHAEGIAFYHGNENVWLADRIPPQYISIME